MDKLGQDMKNLNIDSVNQVNPVNPVNPVNQDYTAKQLVEWQIKIQNDRYEVLNEFRELHKNKIFQEIKIQINEEPEIEDIEYTIEGNYVDEFKLLAKYFENRGFTAEVSYNRHAQPRSKTTLHIGWTL